MKSLKKILACGILSVTVLSGSVMSAGACACKDNCNCKDINAKITMKKGEEYGPRLGGKKNNNHSVYFKFDKDSSLNKIKVSVYGMAAKAGQKNKNLTWVKGTGYVQSVVVKKGSAVQIQNQIKEEGYENCGLKLKNNVDGKKGTVKYAWSPDYCPGYGNVPVAG